MEDFREYLKSCSLSREDVHVSKKWSKKTRDELVNPGSPESIAIKYNVCVSVLFWFFFCHGVYRYVIPGWFDFYLDCF